MVGREFQQSCKAKMLSALTRADCLRYFNAWLKAQGNGDRTRCNKFLHLKMFLTWAGLRELVASADKPKYSSEDPIAIEDHELTRFWQVCPNYKKLLYRLLLECGLRKQEIQTLRWIDIVGGEEPHVQIRPRPEYNYIPKAHHCRDIGIKDELYAELMHRKMVSKHPLVFCTRSGRPLKHFWDDVQAIFKRAGLDMRKAHIHAFRSTFCTTLLRDGMTLQDAMVAMGHSEVESTMRYMAVLERKALHAKLTGVKFKVA
jgi:integrase